MGSSSNPPPPHPDPTTWYRTVDPDHLLNIVETRYFISHCRRTALHNHMRCVKPTSGLIIRFSIIKKSKEQISNKNKSTISCTIHGTEISICSSLYYFFQPRTHKILVNQYIFFHIDRIWNPYLAGRFVCSIEDAQLLQCPHLRRETAVHAHYLIIIIIILIIFINTNLIIHNGGDGHHVEDLERVEYHQFSVLYHNLGLQAWYRDSRPLSHTTVIPYLPSDYRTLQHAR